MRLYYFIKKIFVFLGVYTPKCRFYPSCSLYTKQAFEKKSFFKAIQLSLYRILRCNPWNKGGFDPLV